MMLVIESHHNGIRQAGSQAPLSEPSPSHAETSLCKAYTCTAPHMSMPSLIPPLHVFLSSISQDITQVATHTKPISYVAFATPPSTSAVLPLRRFSFALKKLKTIHLLSFSKTVYKAGRLCNNNNFFKQNKKD